MRREVCRARLAQFDPRLGAVEDNLRRHLELCEQAEEEGCDLLIFPELSLTGYYLRDLVPEVALTPDSPLLTPLLEASRRLHLVVGFVEESPAFDLYCTAAYLAGGEIRHLHRKVYLPTYGMFDEGRYFSAGSDLHTFPTPWGSAGLLICEDLWHPSAPYVLSRRGMDLLIGISASPLRGLDRAGGTVPDLYARMLGTYAELFQCHVLFCNRVGVEDGVTFWGGSRALSPGAGTLGEAPLLEPAYLDVTLDPSALRRARIATPLLSDERPELVLRALEAMARE